MATSPPQSPMSGRPMSALVRPSQAPFSAPRSNSRMSLPAVRVRPPLKPSDPGYELIPQRFQKPMVHVTSNTNVAIDSPQGRKLFVFDRVFGPEVGQDGIWEYVSECVTSFLQGYNVSLLAYGQSGAGKSFTMGTSGPLEQEDVQLMGVIPRAAHALFEQLETPTKVSSKQQNRNSMSHFRSPARLSGAGALGDRNWSLKATYVEIYNEQLRDLLAPEHVSQQDRSHVNIREDTKGNIILTGLTQVDINSIDDLMNALAFGSSIRQTDATAINAKSSRSHAVFSLNLIQRKARGTGGPGERRNSMPAEALSGNDMMMTTDSKLHFVDLAGSERLKNTGAQGERAREGISINAGLAALGKVISQLSMRQGGSHVSYRDSKLTRLLQDSLGGNAITYMIACVTPPEFHLSETLNTVQYAQRARNIQSKPRIQKVDDSNDKHAVIERLKAEVAFLREQIRSAERSVSDRRNPSNDRSDRPNEREVELQNQLLDIQENYTALSQRHAKLISEMAKARNNEAHENEMMLQRQSESDIVASQRLDRSNTFAQAVEEVVLEYEKTIQSLEQSLASTRGTLATTEANLLERETKCAYVETINSQLQARLQKLMDRESSTESYLHDLEAKLDGHTSGEEKNATLIIELRKEIARVRENEATAEDYISTLEERLAEADQDSELMQREMDRLEQVIERQRSLGKLDSLLYELDHIQSDSRPESVAGDNTNAVYGRRRSSVRSRSQSHVSRHSVPDAILEDEERVHDMALIPEDEEKNFGDNNHLNTENPDDYLPQSPAQSKFVADKLESVTQELVDLRVEHEATISDMDHLNAKYEEALRALAELQDIVDETRHADTRPRDSVLSMMSPASTRPDSFMFDRSSGIKSTSHSSTARSLSSELSSAMDSPSLDPTENMDHAKDDFHKISEQTLEEMPNEVYTSKMELVQTTIAEVIPSPVEPSAPGNALRMKSATPIEVSPVTVELTKSDDIVSAPQTEVVNTALLQELDALKVLAAEKQAAEKELSMRYKELESKHSETLDMVEELKTEVSKARANESTSPRTSAPIIRRKSSQNVMIMERAHRSFASLRIIANENMGHMPDAMQGFEINLNAAMNELQLRSQRIQELEAEVMTTKKEMETKMTIITGLTRERSSLKASPRDMSMVSTLRDQLEQTESRLKEMSKAHEAREKQLVIQLDGVKRALEQQQKIHEQMTADEGSSSISAEVMAENAQVIARLESELADWETKHKAVLSSMQQGEADMKLTIEELENQLESVNAKLVTLQEEAKANAAALNQQEQSLIQALRTEIDEYKAILNSNAATIEDLEASSKIEAAAAQKELGAHKELIAALEIQVIAHQEAVKTHKQNLEDLRAQQAKELDEMRLAEQKGYEEQLEVLLNEHAETIRILESELATAREDMVKIAQQVAYALGVPVTLETLADHIQDLIAERQNATFVASGVSPEVEARMSALDTENSSLRQELNTARAELADLMPEDAVESTVTVSDQVTVVKKRLEELDMDSKKNARLVQELEDQLQTNFDQAQMASNRLSSLQSERQMQLEEATIAKAKIQAELDAIREEYEALQAKFEDHMGALHTSGPSPPPVMPLPPIPAGGATSPPPDAAGTSEAMASLAQKQEDQEARIKTLEKHLAAERQMTTTLEEALSDLETQGKKLRADADAWRKRAVELETEIKELKERQQQSQALDNRWSVHVEEERKKRQEAEAARARLEERMNAISSKKKKKGSLNCF
ncbi:hypothetical protein TD95_001649 [Thielaviopsis punctulata]|uniref:Kinesin motor domain-containing protein n=1 Tax=Thielaviopsis punctulata TaxID=72032 RepID=A0A0F4Z8I8_9PEZI|nr:hypothetical protein TD95_001649 [Thielaviopsis punctulata]